MQNYEKYSEQANMSLFIMNNINICTYFANIEQSIF